MNPVDDRFTCERWGTHPAKEGFTDVRAAGAQGEAQAAEAQAARCAEAARPVAPLTPEAMSRIAHAVQRRRHEAVSRGGRGLGLRWQLAIFALVSLASVATAKGMMTLWRKYSAAPTRQQTDPPARARGPARRLAREVAPPVVVQEEPATEPARDPARDPEVEPATEPEIEPATAQGEELAAPRADFHALSSASHRAHARRHAKSPVAPAPAVALPATSSGPGTEAQLLAHALGRLRQEHDPVGALALLDTYVRNFPSGVLASEAQAARIEATLQSGDRPGALVLLDGRASFRGRSGMQWLLTRAELRTSAGRYPEALVDFDQVLAGDSDLPPSEGERALYGRAVCLGRLGRAEKARADLDAYRARFPHGKHAAEVSRLLAGAVSGQAP